jgi:hypothetical protein
MVRTAVPSQICNWKLPHAASLPSLLNVGELLGPIGPRRAITAPVWPSHICRPSVRYARIRLPSALNASDSI